MSRPGGVIRVQWEANSGQRGTELRLYWAEEGGPPVNPPSSTGVGLKLVEGFASSELRGGIETSFGSTGFSCILRVRLAEPRLSAGGQDTDASASPGDLYEHPRV